MAKTRHSGLGRGLGALLGEAASESLIVDPSKSESLSGAMQDMPIMFVEPNPDQPRRDFDEDELEELADSIRRNGILQPIVVRPFAGAYQIVAGERRYQAARKAGLENVPVIVRSVDDSEVLKLALIENLQRADLNPMEAAEGYRSLIEQNGLTQEQLGEVLSKSRSAVANALRLLDLPEDVRELVREGKISAGHARAILAVEGDEGRSALAKKVVEEGLSVRVTETLAPLFSGRETRVPPKRMASPESYKKAARSLRSRLDTKVSVRSVRGKNRIEIEFDDEGELEAIVAKILATDSVEGDD